MSQVDPFSLHFCYKFIIFTVFINSITALRYKLNVMVYNIWLLFYYFEFYVWCYVLLSDLCSVDNSPLKYFMEEMDHGNSLRSMTTIGNEKEQERVYDTIFCLPWRCDFVAVTGEKILDMVSRFR